MTPIAWMGGSRPRPLLELSRNEREYVTYLFQYQVWNWTNYWKEPLPSYLARIFWKRARYDAHATHHNQGKTQ